MCLLILRDVPNFALRGTETTGSGIFCLNSPNRPLRRLFPAISNPHQYSMNTLSTSAHQPVKHPGQDAFPSIHPDPTSRTGLRESKHVSKSKPTEGQGSKRPTHFVCFPLTAPSAIPQLEKSLAYFRQVTTASNVIRNEARLVTKDTRHSGTVGGDSSRDEIAPSQAEASQENDGANEPFHRTMPSEEDVDEGIRIVPEAAHRPPGTYHLTIAAMDLTDPEKFELAKELLQQIDYAQLLQETEKETQKHSSPDSLSAESKRDGADYQTTPTLDQQRSYPCEVALSKSPAATFSKHNPPLSITLHSLSTFPSAKNARVLYALPHDPTQRLLDLGKKIRKSFQEAGLVTDTRDLVLHATVANMIHVRGGHGKDNRRGGKGRKGLAQTIDARELCRAFVRANGRTGETAQSDIVPDMAKHPVSTPDVVDNSMQRSERSSNPTFDIPSTAFIWAADIPVDRIALCKMGAVKSEDPILGMTYPPITEKTMFQP